jgi:hypothetical protein
MTCGWCRRTREWTGGTEHRVAGHEDRIKKYAARAAAGLPLFDD